MLRFPRAVAMAVLALTVNVVAVSQAAAQPRMSSVREFTYITYRAPTPRLAECTTSSSDNGAYALAGWKMRSSPKYDLTLSTMGVPTFAAGIATFKDALNGAVGAWEATDFSDRFGSVTEASVRPRQKFDGQNLVAFARGGRGAVGITRFWVDSQTDTVLEFDVLLNSNYPWSTALNGAVDDCSGTTGAFDVQAVLTHELGHPVGLEHVSADVANDAQTMYPYVATGETRKRSLANGDLAGINLQYP